MTDHVSIVTGASRGIGASTAVELARQGASLVLTARSEEPLTSLADRIQSAGGEALVLAGDISDPILSDQLVAAAISRFGQIDSIVNNAAIITSYDPVATTSPSAWRRNFEVNLDGAFFLVRASLPHLRTNSGHVINVSSGASTGAFAGGAAYSASKAALNSLASSLAEEEPDITALAVSPGLVDTAMQTDLRDHAAGTLPARSYEMFSKWHREGKLMPPEVPARVLAWLAFYAPHDWSGDYLPWSDERIKALL